MYLQHFNLDREPFSSTPDTRFLLQLNNSSSLFGELVKFANSTMPICVVASPPGLGKTTLCRKLLNAFRVHDRYQVFELRQAHIAKRELYNLLADREETASSHNISPKKQACDALEQLIESGKRTLIVIDDAEALPKSTRKALLKLSSKTHRGQNLVQVVMFANNEAFNAFSESERTMVEDDQMLRVSITAIAVTDTATYIEQRLHIAGHTGPKLFTSEAIEIIGNTSDGKPSVINLLARKAMLLAYQEGTRLVEKKQMIEAVNSTDCVQLKRQNNFFRRMYTAIFYRTKASS